MTDVIKPAASCDHGEHGYITDKARYLARLKRIEGQARGVHRMVEDEQYCIDILTQISALTGALQGVAIGLLEDHSATASQTPSAQAGTLPKRKYERHLKPSAASSGEVRAAESRGGCDRRSDRLFHERSQRLRRSYMRASAVPNAASLSCDLFTAAPSRETS